MALISGSGNILMSQRLSKGAKMERHLRAALIVLGLINTGLIAGSGLLLGLCSNQVSIAANFLIFFFPGIFGSPWIRLITDFIFSAGHLTWFVFANIFLDSYYMRWRGTGRVVAGAWSSMFTLAMFFMTAALCLRALREIVIQLRSRARSQRTHHNPSAGCAQCEHCRANEAVLTAGENSEAPTRALVSLVNGIRQWASGYTPLPSYEDSTASEDEFSKIQLEDGEEVQPCAVPIPQRQARDEEEGF